MNFKKLLGSLVPRPTQAQKQMAIVL